MDVDPEAMGDSKPWQKSPADTAFDPHDRQDCLGSFLYERASQATGPGAHVAWLQAGVKDAMHEFLIQA